MRYLFSLCLAWFLSLAGFVHASETILVIAESEVIFEEVKEFLVDEFVVNENVLDVNYDQQQLVLFDQTKISFNDLLDAEAVKKMTLQSSALKLLYVSVVDEKRSFNQAWGLNELAQTLSFKVYDLQNPGQVESLSVKAKGSETSKEKLESKVLIKALAKVRNDLLKKLRKKAEVKNTSKILYVKFEKDFVQSNNAGFSTFNTVLKTNEAFDVLAQALINNDQIYKISSMFSAEELKEKIKVAIEKNFGKDFILEQANQDLLLVKANWNIISLSFSNVDLKYSQLVEKDLNDFIASVDKGNRAQVAYDSLEQNLESKLKTDLSARELANKLNIFIQQKEYLADLFLSKYTNDAVFFVKQDEGIVDNVDLDVADYVQDLANSEKAVLVKRLASKDYMHTLNSLKIILQKSKHISQIVHSYNPKNSILFFKFQLKDKTINDLETYLNQNILKDKIHGKLRLVEAAENYLSYMDVQELKLDAAVQIEQKLDLPKLIEKVDAGVVTVLVEGLDGETHGSGFVVDKEGYVITNYHVVDGASKISVRLNDGQSLRAELIKSKNQDDLAIIKIVNLKKKLPVLDLLADSNLKKGETVVVLGTPLNTEYNNSVVTGIVSGLDRADGFIQISAPIYPGNSGGPVINANGKVIGVATAVAMQLAQGMSVTESGAEEYFAVANSANNVGFVVPARKVKSLMKEIQR